jgi:hypothetical protein
VSAVHGIAWGFIEPEDLDARFKYWRREVRKELRTHRIRLQPLGSYNYTLTSTGKKSGHKRRAFLGKGDFLTCCKIASKLITKPEKP